MVVHSCQSVGMGFGGVGEILYFCIAFYAVRARISGGNLARDVARPTDVNYKHLNNKCL